MFRIIWAIFLIIYFKSIGWQIEGKLYAAAR